MNSDCPELSETQWANKPEFCPVLSRVVEPDVTLPGVANRSAVESEIDRTTIDKVHP